jgi:hypothetical protein
MEKGDREMRGEERTKKQNGRRKERNRKTRR